MQEAPGDHWLAAFTLGLLIASIGAWFYVVARKWRFGCVLPYEPRQPVPWGPLAASLAVVFVVVTIVAAVTSTKPEPPPPLPSAIEAAEQLIGLILFELTVTATAVALVILFSNANPNDLGLPAFVVGLLRDCRIGFVATLAAIAPVFVILLSMRLALDQADEVSRHPLVEMVVRDPNVGLMILASVAAVLAAPVCEEIVFRLLLQGWLEKCEDKWLGWRRGTAARDMVAQEIVAPEIAATETDASEPQIPMIMLESPAPQSRDVALCGDPPRRGVAGLPYGWLPILVSSMLFALAHFGYGPEPVPLFVLALILGYLYQRTHRIVPCIVMHALFNLVTVITLWRLVSLGPE